MKYFYSHIIEIESLLLELDQVDLTEGEKRHLAKLIDANLHHTILDAILSELSEADKKVFLNHLSADEHNKIWQLLNKRIDNIEEKIKEAASSLKEEMRADIKEAERIKN